MSEVTTPQEESISLKTLLNQLGEIDSIMKSSENQVDWINSGSTPDEAKKRDTLDTPTNITIGMIYDRIKVIGRRANSINKGIYQFSGN